jgi:hypothetical protein
MENGSLYANSIWFSFKMRIELIVSGGEVVACNVCSHKSSDTIGRKKSGKKSAMRAALSPFCAQKNDIAIAHTA